MSTMPKKTRRTQDLAIPRYSTFQVADALDIPLNTFKGMQALDLIPVTKESEGRGKAALFSKIDVYTIALQRRFSTHGIRREIAAKHSNKLREELLKGETPPASVVLYEFEHELRIMAFPVVTKEEMPQSWVIDLTNDMVKNYLEGIGFKAIQEFDPEWQIVIAVNFKALQKEVDHALAKVDDALAER